MEYRTFFQGILERENTTGLVQVYDTNSCFQRSAAFIRSYELLYMYTGLLDDTQFFIFIIYIITIEFCMYQPCQVYNP